uniref:GST N-terminal domain-containing protein n=1 Tax=Pyrodinium bahamense TaxID=73915 RepID=A0A7S0BBU4_9DINO
MATAVGGQKPQLLYFNVPGRVAGLRIMLFTAYGKDGWVDRRVEFKDWPQIKATLPLQFVPLLTLPDGRTVHQADTMMRWAAKKAELYPADPDEALFVDEMISTVYEALSKAPRPSSLVTKEMLPELWAEFTAGPMKMYLDYIQGRIAGPFFRGRDLTAADLTLYMLVNYFVNGEISFVPMSYMDGWPGIRAHYAAVKEHSLVVAYDAAYAASDAINEVKEFEKVDTSAIGKS